MDPELNAVFKLPFSEQEKFFKEKLNIPTLKWDDLWKDQHAKGFMVAGAYRDDILADFREAVDKAIEKGTTLEEFRNDFDDIVKKHGWTYNGSRNWRSEVIYSTNMRTSYAAGRWAQLTDPDQLKIMPYLTYKHGDSRVPRPEHLAWDGITLPANDPWWDTHYVPNGWGCKCRVTGATLKDYEKAKAAGKAEAPPSPIDSKTGAPVGIDKGWNYNVGKAAYGRSRTPDPGKLEDLPLRRVRYSLPEKLAGKKLPAALGPKSRNVSDLRKSVPEGVYEDRLGDYMNIDQEIAGYIMEMPERWDGRERFFPVIPDILKNPSEIYLGFVRDANGKVYLRKRYIKAYIEGSTTIGLMVEGVRSRVNLIDTFQDKHLADVRSGRLIYPEAE
ncbi:MAG: phage minor head protein [Candidatus Marinimicrobia bacterium]|jgi:hypothetical protein|nr:phage minor head protein [Candidatus Neomarinimicrobiota bacterium]